MSTLSQYKSLLTQKLATSSTSFYSSEARTAAINEAITDLYNQYDIPQLIKRATLTVASGLATIPSDMARMVKIWDATDANPEYLYQTPDQFDQLATTESAYWTIDYDTTSGTQKIFIKPTSETSLRMRYIITPTTLVADADESKLPTVWDDVVAYGAAATLLYNAKDFNKANSMRAACNAAASRAYGFVKNQGGIKSGSRLRSWFEKWDVLNNNGQT